MLLIFCIAFPHFLNDWNLLYNNIKSTSVPNLLSDLKKYCHQRFKIIIQMGVFFKWVKTGPVCFYHWYLKLEYRNVTKNHLPHMYTIWRRNFRDSKLGITIRANSSTLFRSCYRLDFEAAPNIPCPHQLCQLNFLLLLQFPFCICFLNM